MKTLSLFVVLLAFASNVFARNFLEEFNIPKPDVPTYGESQRYDKFPEVEVAYGPNHYLNNENYIDVVQTAENYIQRKLSTEYKFVDVTESSERNQVNVNFIQLIDGEEVDGTKIKVRIDYTNGDIYEFYQQLANYDVYYANKSASTKPVKTIPVSTTSTKAIPTSTKTIPTTTTSTKKIPTSTKTIPTTTTSTKAIPTSTKQIPTTTTSTKAIPTSTKTIPTSSTSTKQIPTSTKTIPTSSTSTKQIPTSTKTIPTSSTSTKQIPTSTKTIPTSSTSTKQIPTSTKTIPTSSTSTKQIPTSTKTIPTSSTSTKQIPTSTKTIPTSSTSTKQIPTTCKNVTVTVTVQQTVTVTVTEGGSYPTGQPGNCAQKWGQCGGQGYNGPTCCESGSSCHEYNQWYSQCI